jgi:hypothetical protein
LECTADQISQRHHGWLIWKHKPIAVRSEVLRRRPAPADGVYAVTVIADDWDQLEAALTAQDANDAQWMVPA